MSRQSMLLLLVLLTSLTVGCRSKQTYVSQKVCEGDTCFRGVPHLVYEPRRAIVTWSKVGEEPIITNHICRIPVTYSVDVDQARFGTTKATFDMQGDGSLLKAEADVDQQIDELITAVGNAAADVIPGGARGDGSDIFSFTPPLSGTDSEESPEGKGYSVSDIQIVPLY